LVQPEDSSHIELWAWTANPSEIPKRVWLAFTNRPSDDSSAVFVGPDPPPESWHQGARFEVFLHMPLMEDYSAVARDLQSAVDNQASITPIRRRFDWRYNLVDGAPPTARSRFPARLPRPPHDFGERDGHGPERSAPRADHEDPALGRTTAEQRSRDRSGGDDTVGAGGRSGRGTDNRYIRGRDPGHDAHPARDSRDTRRRDKERVRPRPSSSTCKNAAFTWPARRVDDDEDGNDDYVHPGQGSQLGDSYWGLYPRERTRSPPRHRHMTQHGRRYDSNLLQAQFTATLSSVPPPDAPSSLQDDSVAGLSQLVTRVCSLVDRLDVRTDPGDAA
jgi:hypothetical protein